jgi:hypothetical protein
MIPQAKVNDLIALVNKTYPDWAGMKDPRFLDEEINYKRKAVALARGQLKKGSLQQLLDSEQVIDVLANDQVAA